LKVICGLFIATALLSLPARADQCGFTGPGSSACFYNTNVVDVYYGTFTLLSPTGATLATENVVTAETGLALLDTDPPSGQPIGPEGLDASLLSQFEGDIQDSFADLPSFLFTGLTGLEDANGFGSDANADPGGAETSFDQQLALFAGGAGTVSDTGFQQPLISQAYCDFLNSLGLSMCGGLTPGVDTYAFTYQVGPTIVGNDTYTSLTNFELLGRDVTVQETVAPEPESVAEVMGALVFMAMVWMRRRSRAS